MTSKQAINTDFFGRAITHTHMSVFLYNDDGSLMILPGSYEDPGSIILVHITSSPSGCLHTFGRRTMEEHP